MPAFPSYGSSLKMGTATGGTYTAPTTAIGEVTSLNLDGLQVANIDVTNITDRFRKFIPGVVDSGSITCEVNVYTDDSQQLAIYQLLDVTTTTPTFKSFLLEYGDANNKGCKIAGVGIVTSVAFKGAVGEVVSATITIKMTGSLAITDTA